WHVRKGTVEREKVGQVLPPMQRGERLGGHVAKQRHMECIDMEMQDVELTGAAAQLVEHDHVMGYVIVNGGVEADRLVRAGDELSRRHGIAAGEQCDFVTLPH